MTSQKDHEDFLREQRSEIDAQLEGAKEITVSLKQTEYYSATFTLAEAAAMLECEPTEEAIAEAIADGDPFTAGLGDRVLSGWDMAENSEWSII